MEQIRDGNFYFGASRELILYARELRSKMTLAEEMLWKLLRRKQLQGFRFRRQHPISYYIADFLCFRANLIIEVDGEIHLLEEHKIHDEVRTAYLESLGFRVIRFTNREVLRTPEMVIQKIESLIKETER
jgi:5-methyltetrahydrofolate--homocysteine methyltransferase